MDQDCAVFQKKTECRLIHSHNAFLHQMILWVRLGRSQNLIQLSGRVLPAYADSSVHSSAIKVPKRHHQSDV